MGMPTRITRTHNGLPGGCSTFEVTLWKAVEAGRARVGRLGQSRNSLDVEPSSRWLAWNSSSGAGERHEEVVPEVDWQGTAAEGHPVSRGQVIQTSPLAFVVVLFQLSDIDLDDKTEKTGEEGAAAGGVGGHTIMRIILNSIHMLAVISMI